ncbi:MAG: hypothetical protein P0Y56_07370 [Candidatus Andeanibacterium colombiense]|uniref:Uncharacterized protein n=1 Tax=Candidatus Andeanibacterium colombiense TaxID=3121345 RepID=A0AAJ5X975_9SPHN|nr:MAG: hypothetical protein P0Y56_07370 [Sphingomonadaceae bacterium]
MRLPAAFAALALALMPAAAAAETLTNEQIVRLAAAGLGDQVLIAKIRASGNSFDTSIDGLLALRKKGVSNPVIAEMIAAGGGAKAGAAQGSGARVAAALSPDSPDPEVPHPPGIYLLVDWRSPTSMVALPPVTSRRTKSGNLVAYWLTGGIAKRSRKAVISERQAQVETLRRRPVFYFFFGKDGGAPSTGGILGTTDRIASPGDFNLIRFEVGDDGREAKVGSSSRFGSSHSVAEKDRIPFASTQVSPGVYRVQPGQDLAGGEYGFLYSSPSGSGSGDGEGQEVRVFDFSVGDGTSHR